MAERAHPEDPGFHEGTPYRANLFKRYAFANKFTEGKTVLDIPCGVGWGTSLLRAKDRIGIDISLDAVAYGKKHYPGIDFLVGDMANIPLGDSSVDVVVCLEGFEHVSKARGIQFLEEVIRVIKHDGLLVMTVPVILPGSKHSGNPYHLHEPTLCDLKNILAHRFYTKSMEIVEGPDSPIVYFTGSPKRKTCISKFSHEKGSVDCERKDISNILLTTSAAPAQSPFSTKEKRPPIGIGFLISVLRNAGHKAFFIDNYLQPSDFLETNYLLEKEIDYVGIYANTICFRDTLRMLCKLEDLRQTDKWGGKIIVGGPHTTVAVDAIPGFVDYVVQGEGERAILDIVEDRVTDRIVSYPRIENLDALPMPAWDCFVDLPYDWSIGFFEDKPVFTMNTSRGCPFNCTFCSVGSVWGKKYTYFSAERIVSDIEYLINHYGLKGVYFREDNFTLNKERLRKFCNLLIEKGIKISWACESRVSNLTRDLVELMSRAGAKGFYFGVESGSQRILDFLRKDITVEQIKDAFEWCHEFNVKTAASLILGVPSETESDRQETTELLKAIKPDVVWPNVFVGIPDSSLYRFVLNNKLYQYIDDRGLLYLQRHNSRVKRYYGDNLNAYIPDNEENKDMTVKPKVSVLMSVYNCEKFIEQALRSIYNQTCQDFEVVIVDDGSTDKTADILFNMKDSRTFIYRNSENKGLTKSLNIGLKLCRGEYVARMDADDVSYPQRFEKQVKFLDENPDCTALGCWCNRIDSKGQIHGAYDGRPTKPEDIKRQLLAGNCVAHATAMVRRASLAEASGYNEKYTYAQDHDLWLRLSEIGQIYNLGEYLVGLRFWPENITAKKSEQQDKCSELAIQEALQRRKGTEPAAAGKYHEQESDWKPGFSIVMANYNNAKYIAEAIESILRQTFRDWELIIVEDCSTDNSLNIIRPYLSDKRIRLIRHERNRGYTAALKTGIEHVHAEHFGILDSDDCLTGPAIETMYSYHVRFPDCGLIYSQFVYCDEDLTPRQIGYCNKIPADKTNIQVNVVSGFKTFKMKDYLRTSGYDEDILYAEDKDIIYKMEEVTGLKFVDQCLYLARELPGSQSHDPNKALIGRQSDEKAKMNALRRSQLPGKKQHSGITVNLIARYALGFSYLKAGKYSEAQITLEPMLTLLIQALERGPSQLSGPELEKYNVMAECYLRICTTLAQCYLKQERYDKAKQIYSHLLNNQYLGLPEEQKAAINAVLAKLENIRLPALSTEHSRQNLSPKGGESEPLVSVYMVTYNMERFIRQAIDSVLAQTCQNLELLIVDDGSTDGTKDIVASYSDNRIRYIYKPHKNFASGMNTAISEAKGEYLVGVDSDDYIEPDYIEKMVAFADKYPDIDYFYPATLTLIDESGNYTGVDWNYLDFSDNSVLPAFLFDRGYSPIPNSGSLKRRALFNKVELYEELETVEDFTFLCRNALNIRFKRVDKQAKYFYRRLPSSNSLRFKARDELTARAINEMVSIYPPEVLCPQIARISSADLKKRQYLKYVMTTFYKHADVNTSKNGEYYRQYGDCYRAELSQIMEPDITEGTFEQVYGETGLLDWFKQGFEHLKAARPADALTCFNEARQLGDEMANLNYARAVALVQLGRLGDARSACEAELALRPDSQKARTLLNKISEAANAINPAG
jgi:glycosyltransferase involved in cell wall biosynthesis/SAM-dependent methyltransferase